MIGHIDIENSKTKDVITIDLKIIEYIEDKIIRFDLSNISKDELRLLEDAISDKKELKYTDIELFFIDDSDFPEFGPDYEFFIKDEKLVGIYNREIYPRNKK